MVHFSWLQIRFFVLLVALVIAAIFWGVARVAAVVPPALQKPGYKSGVGGVLLFVVVFVWMQAMTPLFRLGREIAEAVRVAMLDTSYTWAALQTVIPDLTSALFLTVAAFMLTAGRSAKALYGAVILGWLGGPLSAFLRAYFLNIPITWNGEPSGMVMAMLVTTLYLLFADRVTLTYGLPKAALLPDRA